MSKEILVVKSVVLMLRYTIALALMALAIALNIYYGVHLETLLVGGYLLFGSLFIISKKNTLLRHVTSLFVLYLLFFLILVYTTRGWIGRNYAVLLGYPLFAVFTYYLLWKYRKALSSRTVFLLLLVYFLFLGDGILHVVYRRESMNALPSSIFFLLGIITGYIVYLQRNVKGLGTLFVGMACAVWTFFEGYDMWMQRLYNDSFTGIVHRKLPDDLFVQDLSGDTLYLSQMKGKLILLDFWTPYCGPCWEAFPEVQELYNEYQSKDVIVATVLMEYSRDGNKRLEDFKTTYDMPVFKIDEGNPLNKSIPIKVFPSYAILDKEMNLVFFGDLRFAKRKLKQMLQETR